MLSALNVIVPALAVFSVESVPSSPHFYHTSRSVSGIALFCELRRSCRHDASLAHWAMHVSLFK